MSKTLTRMPTYMAHFYYILCTKQASFLKDDQPLQNDFGSDTGTQMTRQKHQLHVYV